MITGVINRVIWQTKNKMAHCQIVSIEGNDDTTKIKCYSHCKLVKGDYVTVKTDGVFIQSNKYADTIDATNGYISFVDLGSIHDQIDVLRTRIKNHNVEIEKIKKTIDSEITGLRMHSNRDLLERLQKTKSELVTVKIPQKKTLLKHINGTNKSLNLISRIISHGDKKIGKPLHKLCCNIFNDILTVQFIGQVRRISLDKGFVINYDKSVRLAQIVINFINNGFVGKTDEFAPDNLRRSYSDKKISNSIEKCIISDPVMVASLAKLDINDIKNMVTAHIDPQHQLGTYVRIFLHCPEKFDKYITRLISYRPKNILSRLKKHAINTTADEYSNVLLDLAENKHLTIYNRKFIYDNTSYAHEQFIAANLIHLKFRRYSLIERYKINKKEIINFLRRDGKSTGLDKKQTHAFINIMTEPVSVIIGKAGTGKSMVIATAINFLCAMDIFKCYILAPTGKAASLFETNTKIIDIKKIPKPCTIQKFIYSDSKSDFMIDFITKGSVIIVDEMSMVSNELFYELMKKIKESKATLILLGDINQLPSIDPGDVLNQIVKSNIIPVVELTKIRRQTSGSFGLCHALNEILETRIPEVFDQSFEIFYGKPKKEILKYIKSEINGLDTETFIKKISCMTTTNSTIEEYEGDIRQMLGIPDPIEGSKFSIGDIVRQTKNYNEKKLYNGMFGILREIRSDIELDRIKQKNASSEEHRYGVQFDVSDDTRSNGEQNNVNLEQRHHQIKYSSNNETNGIKVLTKRYNTINGYTSDIKLAYINTVHCMQGSRCETAIIIIPPCSSLFCGRNLLYTAISRAEKKCIIFCQDKKTLNNIVKKNPIELNSHISDIMQSISESDDSYSY